MAFSTEFKVGLFTIVGLSTLAGTGFLLEGTAFFMKKNHFSVSLPNASGVSVRTQVRVAGVQVGTVTAVTVEPFGATINFDVRENIAIPSDSRIQIKSRGMLGDVYLEVERGTSKTYLASGATLPVDGDSGDIQKLITSMNGIAGDVKKIVDTLADALSDDGENTIKNMVHNMEKTAAIIANMLESNDTKISSIIDNLDAFTTQLKALSTDENRKKVANIIDNLNESSVDLKKMMDKVEKGEGTLGQLVAKDDTANEIKQTLKKIQTTVNPFAGLHIGLEDRFEWRYKNAQNGGKFENQFNVIFSTIPSRYYLVGVANGPYGRKVTNTTTDVNGNVVNVEKNTTENTWLWKWNLQISQRLTFLNTNFLGVRVGFFRSSPGFAIDLYTPGNMFIVSTELYNFNGFPMVSDPTYGKRGPLNIKIFGNLFITPHFYITAGVEHLVLLPKPWPFVGAGLYFTDQEIRGLFSSKATITDNPNAIATP